MKLNNPVQCRLFFTDHLQNLENQLWCVRLYPNGDIIDLVDLQNWIALFKGSSIAAFLNSKKVTQCLIVRLHPNHWTSEIDIRFFNYLIKKQKGQNWELCDYIILTSDKTVSLMNHEIESSH